MAGSTLHLEVAWIRGAFSLDLTLAVPPGITVLFGPSGAGKSTCLQIIAGLERPARGRVRLDDEVWLDTAAGVDLPPERRRVAYVFQSLALFPHLDALGNVTYGMDRALPRAERHDRGAALLARFGIAHLARRRPATWSGGEAQRVALARALATQPRVMLLDEPFSALDQALRTQLGEEVRRLADELRLPMVLVTHDVAHAAALGDHVVHLEAGRLRAGGEAYAAAVTGAGTASGAPRVRSQR